MQSIQALQTIANQYADMYMQDEALFFRVMDMERTKYNAKEWYIITTLAQTYVNIKTGTMTRKEGLDEQKAIPFRADRYIRFC